LYYWSRAYRTHYDEHNNKYDDLLPVIVIVLTGYTMHPEKKRLKSVYTLQDQLDPSYVIPDLKLVFLEYDKFNKDEESFASDEDEWINFFKNWQTKPTKLKNIVLEKAYRTITVLNFTESEKLEYEATEKEEADRFENERTLRHEGHIEGYHEAMDVMKQVMKMINEGKSNDEISRELKVPIEDVSEVRTLK
jgi:predicted transposase/invertase (TIGR01784 family)